MKAWEDWFLENEKRLKSAAWVYGQQDWDELFQLITIATWKGHTRYKEDFFNMVGVIVYNEIKSFLRKKKTRSRFLDIEIFDEGFFPEEEEKPTVDWELLFTVAHATGNLDAVKFMRAVLNPEFGLLTAEKRAGGFRWSTVYNFLGLNRIKRNNAFEKLLKDLRKFKINESGV